MKFLNNLTRSTDGRLPPRIVVHGNGGVGKTTLGLSMPKPLLIPVEEGGGVLEYEATPSPKTFADLAEILDEIESVENPKWETIVLDSIDKVEPLIWRHTCEIGHNGSKANIESFGYGKGYTFADPHWLRIFLTLDRIRRKGLGVFVIAHSASITVDDPVIGSFNRMQPKLHKRASATLVEWADIVGYMDMERVPVDRGTDKRTTRTSATTGNRRLHVEDGGGFAAKNRYGMSAMMDIPTKGGASVLLKAMKQGGTKA